MTSLLRYLLTFDQPVPRAPYIRYGVALAALKYAGDVAIVGISSKLLWTPLDYGHSLPFLMGSTFFGAPRHFMPLLALWTLPFLWIGVTMTMRRALDAGRSAWWCLLFFIPFVNYLLIAVLAVLPTATVPIAAQTAPRAGDRRLPGALLSMAAGLAFGLAMIALSVSTLGHYGLALFMGTPFGIGACTGFLFNRRFAATAWETFEVVAFTLCLVGGVLFLFGREGAVCLAMALPIGLVLGGMGGQLGRVIATRGGSQLAPAVMAAFIWPATAVIEPAPRPAALHEVRSAIDVHATPDRVWENVIAFPPLAPSSELPFRLGVAYPQSAHIDGAGVGATRYCVFSTGPFVEPITRWEPGRHLSFDVSQSPPPLRELTFYSAIAPPHLDGYLRPRRGEFRLIPLPGGWTRLEGSTWYELRIEPDAYWTIYSDYFISRIHHRVLEHIKRVTESAPHP
jgi:Protein of unknown function (DUF805)